MTPELNLVQVFSGIPAVVEGRTAADVIVALL
jgi:hypothetical protein